MVTLLEGGNKTPHTPQKCSPLCWEPIKRTPQSRSSLHNQIKTSPSQTIFKQSEHRCDSRQESTWLCLHEKDTTKMLPSNSNRVTCRQRDPPRRAPCCSPLAPWAPPRQLACAHRPAQHLTPQFSDHWQRGRGNVRTTVSPCIDFINEKSELYFLVQ